MLSLPGHLLFYYVISQIKMFNHADSYNAATTTPQFIIFYLYVTVLQVNFNFFYSKLIFIIF
jgi:hypothetical protein